jgi:hypothetical protein
MSHKFEFTGETKVNMYGVTLHRIRATEDIPGAHVKKGDVGGWIESAELTCGDARVSGDAWVYGNARVYGNAQVEKSWHFMIVGPIGSENVTATLYRTKNGEHQLVLGCWTGTLGTLMAEVKRRRQDWSGDEAQHELWTAQYKALKALGKATVARWVAAAAGSEVAA